MHGYSNLPVIIILLDFIGFLLIIISVSVKDIIDRLRRRFMTHNKPNWTGRCYICDAKIKENEAGQIKIDNRQTGTTYFYYTCYTCSMRIYKNHMEQERKKQSVQRGRKCS